MVRRRRGDRRIGRWVRLRRRDRLDRGVRSVERCDVLGSCTGSVCPAFRGAAGDVVRFAAVARRRSSETAGASRG
jgi:hypothetical protein